MESYNQLIDDLEHKLKALEGEIENLYGLSEQSMVLCKEVLEQLRNDVRKRPFNTIKEEIEFYKVIKPKVVSYLMFYAKRLHIESKRPRIGKKAQIKYLKKHITALQKYFNNNYEFYLYHKSNSSHLDEHYFLPKNKTIRLNIDHCHFFSDGQFSTSHDMAVATIMANTRLIIYLKSEIAKLNDKNNMETTINPFKKQSNLKWTGTPTELVEMCYSLYASNRVNNGDADIIAILHGLEELFNIKIKDPYGTFSDIRGRKINLTVFMDSLKTALIRYMSDFDDLKGNKP